MRLIFAGTPDAAVPALRQLAAEHEILAVITRPDAPVGRKRTLTASPVAHAAAELELPVIKAAKLDETVTQAIADLNPELGVIVAYGGLVRNELLAVPELGWINLHFSLLPRWRGAAPVQWSLINGDHPVGASVFQLVLELDAGDIYDSRSIEVPQQATAAEVLEVMADQGADLTASVVAKIAAGTAMSTPQVGEVTLAPKLQHADGQLRWSELAEDIYNRFRGVTPEPGAWAWFGDDQVKILDMTYSGAEFLGVESIIDEPALSAGESVGTKSGVLVGTGSVPLLITRVQPAGKAAMNAADWWRGRRPSKADNHG